MSFNVQAAIDCTASVAGEHSEKIEVTLKPLDASFYGAQIGDWEFLVTDFTAQGGPLMGQILLNSDPHEGSDNTIGYLLVGQVNTWHPWSATRSRHFFSVVCELAII